MYLIQQKNQGTKRTFCVFPIKTLLRTKEKQRSRVFKKKIAKETQKCCYGNTRISEN